MGNGILILFEIKIIRFQNLVKNLWLQEKGFYICIRLGEMAERSNALVLKTSEGHTSGGSNPSFSAKSLISN